MLNHILQLIEGKQKANNNDTKVKHMFKNIMAQKMCDVLVKVKNI